MDSGLQAILDERAYDTVSLTARITKPTEEIIWRYANYYNLDYDVALEMLIQYPPDPDERFKILFGVK